LTYTYRCSKPTCHHEEQVDHPMGAKVRMECPTCKDGTPMRIRIEGANYFDFTLWGKQAEGLSRFLVKGKQIGINGELQQKRWEQDGQKRSKVEIRAITVQLLGGKDDSQGGESQRQATPKSSPSHQTDTWADDDIPF
jgi:single stranded DNA-binding protein